MNRATKQTDIARHGRTVAGDFSPPLTG
jgi:hypothetical protein